MAIATSYSAGDLGKCVTAIYWGSSGRRFKSCQPDAGQRWFYHRTTIEDFKAYPSCYPNWGKLRRHGYTHGQRHRQHPQAS